MDIVWKYKIDLTNEGVFSEIEKERGIKIPDALKKLVVEANASTPDKYNFMVGSVERILGAVLSFNRNEDDTDNVFTALGAIEDTNLFPFGIDPFGNYICLNLSDGIVVFWDHETGTTTSTEKKLESFLDSLY